MISKKYRLSEREVKKVLSKAKPFFSYWIVLNLIQNKLNYNRYAIVIWAKSVVTNVGRNYFRRRFYDMASQYCETNEWKDLVFVVKKQTKLDKTDEKSINNFRKDLEFLFDKIK